MNGELKTAFVLNSPFSSFNYAAAAARLADLSGSRSLIFLAQPLINFSAPIEKSSARLQTTCRTCSSMQCFAYWTMWCKQPATNEQHL